MVQVVLAAASPWSKRSDTTQTRAVPPNVTVRRFSQFDLRQLYAQARFVVVPLFQVNFQAGVTTILEAMAMGKAVIVTRTPGQTDYIQEGVTGLYVPLADAPWPCARPSNICWITLPKRSPDGAGRAQFV